MQRGEACVFCQKPAKRRTKHLICARCWNMPRRRTFVQSLDMLLFLYSLFSAPEVIDLLDQTIQRVSTTYTGAVAALV